MAIPGERLSSASPSRAVAVPGVTAPRQGRRAQEIGQEGAESWWILAAGGDENPTFGGAGQSVGDSGPPGDKTRLQAPPVDPTDEAKGLGTGGIGQEGAESWWILAAGGDGNPTFEGAGSTVGDSSPPRDKKTSTGATGRPH